MAPERSHTPQRIRFGQDFELDSSLYELRRKGRAVKLERVPMEVLLLLLEERSRVVSRQEILDAVWGEGVALDADNSINGAIRKIRQALRDDPDHPQYIQTITGRGYRFIATVAREEPARVEQAPGAQELPAQPVGGGSAGDSSSDSDGSRGWGSGKRLRLLAGLALVLALAFVSWRWERHRAQGQGTVRLAVLPFQNLTGDPQQEYLSDGFTEEMITQLGSLDPQHLAVIARTSVMSYKNARVPLTRIAHELHVQYVLEGSVRRDAERVRVTAQLIQVRDQTHLWAREYDRAPQDVLEIQSEIAGEIADEIQLTLGRRHAGAVQASAVLSPREYEAWDDYQKGRYLWRKRTGPDFQAAVGQFQQAIAVDPNYARAWAGLADSWALLSSYGYVAAEEYMPRARSAALRALQLDPSLPEAHTSLALVAENYDWDWQTAEKEYRRAIELNANYATAHHWLAECLAYEGRFDEARAESEKARMLDPLSTIIAADGAAIDYFARQYDAAAAGFQSVLELDPGNGRAHLIIDTYVQQGRYAEALAAIREWKRQGDGPWIWAKEAMVYGRSGDQARARQALAKVEKAMKSTSFDPDPMLDQAYSGVGDREKWLAVLEDACRRHTSLATTLKVDPRYDPLRSDARFQAMLRGAGLSGQFPSAPGGAH